MTLHPTPRRAAVALAVLMQLPGAGAAGPTAAAATGQVIAKAGTQPSPVGPQAFFTGRVRVDPLWPASVDARRG